jgi:V/A-type H+/Na+-transporting ATPase subunit C
VPSDYGYINARVRGQHSQLLGPGAYQELLDAPGYPPLEKWMETGPYSKQWQLATARYQGLEALEWSLEKNFCQATELLQKIAEGQPRQLISLVLRRWDLSNLTAIARGIHGGWAEAEILKSILPAGGIGEVRLKELARQKDLAGLSDTLYTWGDDFYLPVKGTLESYQKDKDLAVVEVALYKHYFSRMLKELPWFGKDSRVLKDIFKKEIDFLNAKTLKRLQGKKGIDAAVLPDHFIPGGNLFTRQQFLNYFDRKEGPKILKSLKGTIYYPFLSGTGPDQDPEQALEQAHFHELARLYQGDPLGIDLVLGYLWQKYYEVINLRLLARGKFYGIPAAQISGELKLF